MPSAPVIAASISGGPGRELKTTEQRDATSAQLSGRFGAEFQQVFHHFGTQIEDHELVAGIDQMARHGIADVAGADEADRLVAR